MDDSKEFRNASGTARWALGYVVAILFFLIILWNTLILMWRLLDHWLRCRRAAVDGGQVNGFTLGTMQLDDDYE